jgi:ribose transport system substrate-binding protein
MKHSSKILCSGLAAAMAFAAGCGSKEEMTPAPSTGGGGDDSLLSVEKKAEEQGDYVILGTLTDQFDRAKAKANVEDTLAKHTDIDGMVGLFAYNPPAILEALKQADKTGKVKVIAFDEDDATLQGIIDGTVHGTVVQDPYMYGYKSIEVLNALHKGDKSVIPENKFINIDAQQIRKDNVEEFWKVLKERVAGGGDNPQKDGKPKFTFVSNGVASFWTICGVGVHKAGADLGVNTEMLMPAEGIPDQKRIIEDQVTKKVNGIAVSPIAPSDQTELLNDAASKLNLITADSDAPDSKRLVYVGMDNYIAGRMCGKLVKEALPNGGKIMIFVGRMEQDNARLRRQGVIDELLGRSEDSTRFDPPDAVLKGR